MGVDLGSRRIGIALCDGRRTMAFPWGALARSGDPAAERRALIDLVVAEEVVTVVVGLPLSLDGSHGPAARAALVESELLTNELADRGVEVVVFDERFTTITAEGALGAAGKRGKARRNVVDAAAATVLLQAWLEAQRT